MKDKHREILAFEQRKKSFDPDQGICSIRALARLWESTRALSSQQSAAYGEEMESVKALSPKTGTTALENLPSGNNLLIAPASEKTRVKEGRGSISKKKGEGRERGRVADTHKGEVRRSPGPLNASSVSIK